MKQIVKRIITFALSAAMVLTLVPTTAFAEDTGSNKVNKNLRVSGTTVVNLSILEKFQNSFSPDFIGI